MSISLAKAMRRAPAPSADAVFRRRASPPTQPPADTGLLGALAIFAHDLRGPLANLGLLLELMTKLAESGRTETLATRSQQAHAIVDSLNDFLTSMLARVRATGDPLSSARVPVALDGLMERVASLSRPLAESRGVKVERRGRRKVQVLGDEQLLIQALDNILGNAVKHTAQGTTVTCEAAIDKGHAAIRIADHGPGFAADDMQRAFRPFTKLSAAAGDGRDSFGLGLWIARLIAERHGGSVEARARPNAPGAMLTLRLPLARGRGPERAIAASDADARR